ncbi:AI-2E family transporter [Hydrogenobacter hydrogenophilus]|uniref:Predicted PurR-regulated permease PerM n=1 Tax=Hydrogenobacter hydrogenophilus TaxID=35835 RepID=A0A285P3N4_9AQUI|nr:AI-2E family transporter [Hydrogenobacter hydrogenophilus]SNZ15867.1 Predicted PurR-regulated permease PerM [Hydrogenobacter hydrogenophilus]
MSKERVFSYFLLGMTLLFAILVLLVLMPFLNPILWAIIFSLVAYPVHLRLSNLLRSATISSLLITFAVALFIVIPVFFIGIVAVRQSVEITRTLLDYFQSHTMIDALHNLYRVPFADRILTEDMLQKIYAYAQSDEFRSSITSYLGKLTQKAGELFTSMLLATGSVIFKSFVFLISLFFILRDGRKFIQFFERFLPMYKEDLYEILLTIYKTILAVVYGSIGVAVVQAVLGFVAYTIVGVNYSLVWALLTFIASFVPPFGTGFVWFPIAVYTFLSKGIFYGIFMLLWGILVISTVDNIIRPMIMKKGINMPYIVLFFSTVGGMLAFGFIGLFLGPLVFTVLFSLAVIYERRLLKEG